ncbi:hypothetical protein HBI56_125190 [Parastagonospora nodorum]|nr:hypothetical protein HBH69_128980 [Parastagonospora nodorum]KAH5409375.1 hypothetical protein HBI46_173340 [Parastagonospora nodorum]KAH6510266.1 hypothetical protein HBI56_125190 [Parastagonospora nodorum]
MLYVSVQSLTATKPSFDSDRPKHRRRQYAQGKLKGKCENLSVAGESNDVGDDVVDALLSRIHDGRTVECG